MIRITVVVLLLLSLSLMRPVLEPVSSVALTGINFGQVTDGSSASAVLVIEGNVPFALLAITSDNPLFTVTMIDAPLPVALLPGMSVNATIQFTCPLNASGPKNGLLILVTDPPNLFPPVPVKGTCSEVGVDNSVDPATGGTIVDPQTGASIEIPRHTLKTRVSVKVITLNSPRRVSHTDTGCGVPIRADEPVPEVRGLVRATDVVRFEAQPCGAVIFGPSARITMPLRRSVFPQGLPIGTSLPLFELARSERGLVFLNSGMVAKVTGPGRSRSMGDFAVVPDIQVFSTFAAFCAGDGGGGAPNASPAIGLQSESSRLYFPNVMTGGRQTRLSICNPEPSTTLPITLTAYDELGGGAGTQSRMVPANRQESYLVSTLFPGLSGGSILAERQGGKSMAGLYEIADSFPNPSLLAGAGGAQAPGAVLIFPVIKSAHGGYTEIHIFNSAATDLMIKLAGFTASGDRVNPTNSSQQPVNQIPLPGHGTLVLSTTGLSGAYDVQLNFAALDGGHVVVDSMDGAALMGNELFGEIIGGVPTLAALNALPFPFGCRTSSTEPDACHVDASPESPVPSAIRQHTLYATVLESSPADAILSLVNVGDGPADVGLSAFSELGQFVEAFPRTGFMTLGPHQIFRKSLLDLFGFNPSPGYVRVEDQHSSIAGAVVIRKSMNGNYATIVPLMAEDPQLSQTPTTAFFSRLQLDPASASPRLTTGVPIFNPNNNPIQFTIKIIDASGAMRQSASQAVVERGVFTRTRLSLSVLFPGITISSGFAQVQVTSPPGPGLGGRLMPVAVYRSGGVVSVVPPQDQQP
jgi:hypothetical protein